MAPTSFPSTYTGLPLMPPATPVRIALPPILPRMMSCFGPQAFFHRPTISTGTASGSVPSNTVQAVACMPGFRSAARMISTLPERGGWSVGVAGRAARDTDKTAMASANQRFIEPASSKTCDLGRAPGTSTVLKSHYRSELLDATDTGEGAPKSTKPTTRWSLTRNGISARAASRLIECP